MDAATLPPGVACFGGVSWEEFDRLQQALGERAYPRMTFLHGEVEIMSPPSSAHEDTKSLLGMLLEVYFRAQKIRFYRRGAPTLRKPGHAAGEPDESYCIGEYKATPDLAVEVVVTHGSLNKLEVYKILGVPEVWFWRDGTLRMYSLEGETYQAVSQSVLLPDLDIPLLSRCLAIPDQYDAVEVFQLALKKA